MPERPSRPDNDQDEFSDPRPASALARLTARVRDTAPAGWIARVSVDYVKAIARRIARTDLDAVVERAGAIKERFRSDRSLRRFREDALLLLSLIRDVRRDRYREVPVWTLSAAGFALLYVLNPFDLIPDALPVVGMLDDAAVVSVCLSLAEQDLHDYRAWKQAQSGRRGDDEDENTSPDLISS
jgi:uncharacterized membrane protein YkvA (DUF1232 family)